MLPSWVLFFTPVVYAIAREPYWAWRVLHYGFGLFW